MTLYEQIVEAGIQNTRFTIPKNPKITLEPMADGAIL